MSSNSSAKNPVVIPAEKKAEHYRLTNPPPVAWPTVAILAYVVGGVACVTAAAVMGVIPLWMGMILNVFAMYPFFHVMHDSFHRAASSNVKLNDWIGRIVLVAVGFHATLEAARYSHMMHHRFTNDELDPDHYFHGRWWSLPFRWATMDYYYYIYNWRSKDPRARKLMLKAIPLTLASVGLIVALISAGYGLEVLMLWFIPQRISVGLISFAFLWLPHLDGDEHGNLTHIDGTKMAGSAYENVTAGTTMRLGFERLLAPLLQWHNYHLIHHLWPTTPSYNHAKVWDLMGPELWERDLRVQRNFELIPTLHVGRAAGPAVSGMTGATGG